MLQPHVAKPAQPFLSHPNRPQAPSGQQRVRPHALAQVDSHLWDHHSPRAGEAKSGLRHGRRWPAIASATITMTPPPAATTGRTDPSSPSHSMSAVTISTLSIAIESNIDIARPAACARATSGPADDAGKHSA